MSVFSGKTVKSIDSAAFCNSAYVALHVAAVAAFRGEFVGSKLIFDTGDSLSTFKLKLRKAGLYPKAAV